MIKASIVVPVYNVEKYLEKCVNSLTEQTIKNIEIILVDDGSKDTSGEICDKLKAADSRIKVIHKENQGVSAARNDGLKVAQGEWITFCDSDDWMEKDFCESLIMYGEKNDSDVVVGDVRIVEEHETRDVKLFSKEFCASTKEEKDELIKTVLCKFYSPYPTEIGVREGLFGGPWNKIVKRKLLVDNNIKFDLRVRGLYDDLIYTSYIYAAASKIAYKSHVVYNYRQVSGSITHRYNKNIVDTNNRIFYSWQEFFDKYENDGEYQNAFYMNVLRRLKGALNSFYFHIDNDSSKKEKIDGVKALLGTDPYKRAIAKVDTKKMPKSYKIFVTTLKMFGPFSARILYLMRGQI